jgi:phage-related protein
MTSERLSVWPSLAASIRTPNLGEGEGPGVFEVVESHRADTFRAVYTVKFESAVYVLHAFQKKSPSGIKTARKDVELIGRRLSEARTDYEVRYGKREK